MIAEPAMQHGVDLDLPECHTHTHTHTHSGTFSRIEPARLIGAIDSVIVSNYNNLPLGKITIV